MFLAKQDIKSIPFQILHEQMTLASRNIQEILYTKELEAHERLIASKEKYYAGIHEAPDEGELRERYPFRPPSEEMLQEEKVKAENEAFNAWAKKYGISAKALWLLPQVTAYIAKMTLPRDKDGKISPREFLKANFSVDDWHKGLYRYCTARLRGSIVPKQIAEQFRNYSALVPLLMMPFKKFDAVQYSEWSREGLHLILDKNLFEAMSCTDVLTLTNERLLENREHALIVKTGEKAGTRRDPISTYKLFGSFDDELKALPWYCQVMATQIWVAHPSIRTNLMVLDWLNWDNMPQPLIDIEVLPATESKYRNKPTPIYTTSDLPWEN
jgi:hypothetical protein